MKNLPEYYFKFRHICKIHLLTYVENNNNMILIKQIGGEKLADMFALQQLLLQLLF